MRILIVDDEFSSRKILQMTLKDLGDCEMACSGEEAFAAYHASIRDGQPYDLILLDIMMPGIDGNEVLRRIRSDEEKENKTGGSRVRIAMATSLGDKQHVLNAFHDGCDGYILKPYTPESVRRDLKRHGLIH